MKNVLITGATSGIGKACVLAFAEAGYRVVFCGRRAEKLQTLSLELGAFPHYSFVCDVRDQAAVDAAIAEIPAAFTPIDILVNNAGLARGKTPIQEGVLSDWEEMIDTNVKGLLYVSKAVLPQMISQNSGHIFNIGSIAGKETYAQGNVYCATKKAVDALTQGMRIDLLPHHIRVTQICPGAVNTEFSTVRFHGDTQKADAVYKNYVPLLAEDIARTLLHCAQLPEHVNINDLTIMPTAQATASLFHTS